MFIVTKEIDSENIGKLCRTCLREDGDRMVCLFVGPAGSSLAAKLRSLSCLEVWQGDGLPEKMCDRCVTRAESALLYREQCRAADRALRQAASKVSGPASYATLSGCKLYQQSQGFVPIQTSRKASRRVDRGAAFSSYQEVYAHGGSHLPFSQDETSVQHARIVESQNPYLNFNFGHFGPSIVDDYAQNTRSSLSVASSATQAMASNAESSSRAACALHCSLCNRVSGDGGRLTSHDVSRNNENVDLSCDNENVEICENSNQIPQNLSYERSIGSVENSMRNLPYQRASINENDAMQNMSFPENIDLEGIDEGETDRVPHPAMHPEVDASSVPVPRYAKDIDRPEANGTIDGYRACSADLGYKRQMDDGEPADPQTRRYRCEACPKLFSQKSKLSAHRFSHSGAQPFKCSTCEKAYASKSKLNAHLRLHTKTNVHRCKVCEKIFSYPSYLREHLKTHDENTAGRKSKNSAEKSFECSHCDKRFRLLKNAKNHERLHTGKGSMQCEICDKRFSRNYNLKIHLRTHKATRLHKCEYCNKCFVQKGNLVEHVRIHTKVKPFECKMCDKRFAQSGHLKSHEASHASLRQHQCRLCGKRFKLANHLKRHLTLHTGAKAYKCYECNQLFSQPFSLTRHLKRHNESRV